MNRGARMAAIARLDLAEVLRSRWLAFCSVLYAALGALFILVGLRESNVLGFTGMGRVLLSLCNVLVLILPLLALAASGQVVNRSREDGTLELLFSLPVTRGEYFGAVSVVRFLALLVPLLVVMPGLGVLGRVAFGQPIPWEFLGRSLAISASLLWGFVGIGLIITVLVGNQAKALMYLLLAWVTGVALLDFGLVGLMLQWRLNPESVFILACLNPVQCARMALLSAADPSLGTLGPVGFYLANRVGVNLLFLLGVAWPALLGSLAWAVGWRSFRRGDLV
ncbi:MAG: ABC transporter permease [Isosphaeraceae bacterium]